MLVNKNRFLFHISLPLLFAATYFLVLHYFQDEKQRLLHEYTDTLEREYTIIVNEYTTMADLIVHNAIETEEVLNILKKVRESSSPAYRNILRRELLLLLSPLYSDLSRHNFRQLHFHEPDNRSFLRLHKPEKFGDDLTGVRLSVEYVNRTGRRISGFEEGRIFNGYRNVYPLSQNNIHLGSVELSISMSAVVSRLLESFKVKSQFILLRSVVDDKVFASEQSNYREWPVDQKFVIDMNISENCLLLDHIGEKESRSLKKILAQNRSGSEAFSREIIYGSDHMVISFLPILNFSSKTVAYIFTIEDNDKLKNLRDSFLIITASFFLLMIFSLSFLFYSVAVNRKIEAMITYDPLTKAFSRKEIFSRLNSEHYRCLRYGAEFSICMIDIDHFKKVNDTYGHQTGDKVLSELSGFILSRLRNSDHFGRYGGEEFMLILPETEGAQAFGFLDSLRKQIGEFSFTGAGKITVSIGLAVADDREESPEELINRADVNLYKAKKSGRDKVVYE